MNFYVRLINEAVEYIEGNIYKKIMLEDIASHFNISKFHFNRMFKTVSGITLKQYILGRKLTEALKALAENEASIIDAAYNFGFEYPEVFSRAFKKHFGVSPSAWGEAELDRNLIHRVNIVEREIISCKGTLTLSGEYIYLREMQLTGLYLEVDTNSDTFKSQMNHAGATFLEASGQTDFLNQDRLYVVVSCHETDNGEYTVFYGREAKAEVRTFFEKRIVPEGWYVRFLYTGDMFEIREAFIDDLYRWIMVKEAVLNPNGVGMLNLFEKDYPITQEVQIYVPIKKPNSQQERS